MDKSSRHSKITGDFAEGLVLYWLSKYGYECARVDHVGIDLIACRPNGGERMGISVKCRSRYDGTEKGSINLPPDGFVKAAEACKVFGLIPYYAVVVDGGGYLRCFLTSLAHLSEKIAGGTPSGMRKWRMSDDWVNKYRVDPLIENFELQTIACSWQDNTGKLVNVPGACADGTGQKELHNPTSETNPGSESGTYILPKEDGYEYIPGEFNLEPYDPEKHGTYTDHLQNVLAQEQRELLEKERADEQSKPPAKPK